MAIIVGQQGYIKLDRANLVAPPRNQCHGIPKWENVMVLFGLIYPTMYMHTLLGTIPNVNSWLERHFGTSNSMSTPPVTSNPLSNSLITSFIVVLVLVLPFVFLGMMPCVLALPKVRGWLMKPRTAPAPSCLLCIDQGLPCFNSTGEVPLAEEVIQLQKQVTALRDLVNRHDERLPRLTRDS